MLCPFHLHQIFLIVLSSLALCPLVLAQTESHTTSVIPEHGVTGSPTASSTAPVTSSTYVGYAPYGNSTCALKCSYGTDTCSMIDSTCLCTNDFYQNSVEDCMEINCTGETRAAKTIRSNFCQPVLQAIQSQERASASAAAASSSTGSPNSGMQTFLLPGSSFSLISSILFIGPFVGASLTWFS